MTYTELSQIFSPVKMFEDWQHTSEWKSDRVALVDVRQGQHADRDELLFIVWECNFGRNFLRFKVMASEQHMK